MNIKDVIREAFVLKNEIAQKTEQYNADKAAIQEHFDKRANIGKIIVDEKLVVQKAERVYIEYFVDKLRHKLNKNKFNKIVKRNYSIKNIEALIDLMKKAGVKPNEFKKLIEVEFTVDKDQLKQLYEVGDILKDDLDGCYEAKIVKYIDLKEKKGDSN